MRAYYWLVFFRSKATNQWAGPFIFSTIKAARVWLEKLAERRISTKDHKIVKYKRA